MIFAVQLGNPLLFAPPNATTATPHHTTTPPGNEKMNVERCQHARAIPSLDHAAYGGFYCPDCKRGVAKHSKWSPAPEKRPIAAPNFVNPAAPPPPRPDAALYVPPPELPTGTKPDPTRPWEKWTQGTINLESTTAAAAPEPPPPPPPSGGAGQLAPIAPRSSTAIAAPSVSPESTAAPPGGTATTAATVENTPAAGTAPPEPSEKLVSIEKPLLTNSSLTSAFFYPAIDALLDKSVSKQLVSNENVLVSNEEAITATMGAGVYVVSVKGRKYFRYIAHRGHEIEKSIHIPGGNINKALSRKRAGQVREWIAQGRGPIEIEARIRQWNPTGRSSSR